MFILKCLQSSRGRVGIARRDKIKIPVLIKVNEGSPNAVERMEAGEIQLVINTPLGSESHYDEAAIRAAALRLQIPCLTTLSAAAAAVEGIRAWREEATGVSALQEYHRT